MKITGNSPHLFSLYLVKVHRHDVIVYVKCIISHTAHDIRDRTELVTHCFSQNCDSTVSNLCSLWCSISWYVSCWNFIKLCCLQWKLYTKNLGGPLIMAHRIYIAHYTSNAAHVAMSKTGVPCWKKTIPAVWLFVGDENRLVGQGSVDQRPRTAVERSEGGNCCIQM